MQVNCCAVLLLPLAMPLGKTKMYYTTRYAGSFTYALVLGLLTQSTGKPERVFEMLEYFRAGTHSIYDLRVRASRVYLKIFE